MVRVVSRLFTMSTFCSGVWSMYVYSLMARTRSEMRDVPLSISFSRVATSTDAAILTRAALAVSASSVANNDSSASGLTFSARQIRGHLPQVILSVTAQQGIDLLFQIADGQRIGRNLVALDERSFQFFDFSFLRRRQIPTSQFVARIADFLQDVAQLARGAFRGGSWIIEFMGKPGGKLTQRSQPVALLFTRVVSRTLSDIMPTNRAVNSGIFCTSSGN